jgi:hypothetical protein
VDIIVEPAPVLPVLPTATQSLSFEHEMPVILTALLGVDPTVHVLPLSELRIAYGVVSTFEPPATQVFDGWQLMAVSTPPLGIELVLPQLAPPLVVSRFVAPPPEARPATTQFIPLEQDSAVSDSSKG